MIQRKVLYIVLWHIGFMLLYMLGALLMLGAKDFDHLNVHLLNITALCTIIMVLLYQFIITASFIRKANYYEKPIIINFVVIVLLYLLYLGFYGWLFVDYLSNRQEHLYFGLRDLKHLFEVKKSVYHIGFFGLMIYSAIIYFFNFYLVSDRIKRIPASMHRKAFYKVYYNPIVFSLIISAAMFVTGFFILQAQGLML